jgi:remodeling and spacing factor 1
MLLCDKCDAGWHASCLRPALLVIPEGDWYCPDCQHSGLIEGLEASLKSYAALYKSKEAEIKRRERLAFVSMSLQNIIPSSRDKFHPAKANPKATEKKSATARKPRRKRSDDEDSSSGTYLDLSRSRFC